MGVGFLFLNNIINSSAEIDSDQLRFSLLLLFGAHSDTPCVYGHRGGSSKKAIGFIHQQKCGHAYVLSLTPVVEKIAKRAAVARKQ